MKKWNTPNVEELKINETANGIFNTEFETAILFNDSFSKSNTPDEKDDVVEQLS